MDKAYNHTKNKWFNGDSTIIGIIIYRYHIAKQREKYSKYFFSYKRAIMK